MTGTELATSTTSSYERFNFTQRTEYANLLSGASDLIPRGLHDRATGKPSAAKIFLVMETGAMLGLAPMAAIAGMDVIEGRACISPQMMTGLLRSHGFKIRYKETGSVAGGDFAITCTLIRPGDLDSPEDWFTSTWDIPRAIRAGLVDAYQPDTKGVFKVVSKKDNWAKYAESMCRWRATGDVGRAGGDDVLLGIGYTPEEMNATIGQDGQIAAPDPEREADYVTRLLACTDKEQVRVIYREINTAEHWTDKLRGTIAEALAGCTTDSNPKDGAPGNTGNAALDSAPDTVAVEEDTTGPGEVTVEPEEEASFADPTTGEMTAEQFEAHSAAEADRAAEPAA